MSRLAVALILLAAAAVAAFFAFSPAVRVTAAIAAYAAAVATLGLVVNLRRELLDRSDLQAKVTLEWFGPKTNDNRIVQIRFTNGGRRPVRVEEAGFWAGETRADDTFSETAMEDRNGMGTSETGNPVQRPIEPDLLTFSTVGSVASQLTTGSHGQRDGPARSPVAPVGGKNASISRLRLRTRPLAVR